MKYIRLFLLLCISAVFFTSCKKSAPKQTRIIPKDAVFVATINIKSLQNKLEKNQATIENIIRNISGSDTSVRKGKQEWQDLKESGIDLTENFYVSVVNKSAGTVGGKATIITSAIALLKDEGKLEAYIKKKDPESEIRKEKNYTYTAIHGNKVVAWAQDVVVMMSSQKSFTTADMEYDSTTGSFNLRNPANAINEMKTEIESDFNLKEDQSVAAIQEFRDLMQEKSDAGMWVNSSASIQQLPLPLPKLKELFSNSFTAAKVNFEDGKITIDSKSYYSNELKDLLKKYSGPTADLSLVENYPSDNINGFGVFSFNPQLIDGIVKYLEVGGVVDGYLTQMMGSNYTLPEALKAIKGDFAITMSDFADTPAGGGTIHPPLSALGSDTTKLKSPNLIPNLKTIVNIPVGDKVQMNRLLDKLVEMQMLIKNNGQYILNANLQKLGYQFVADDKNIYIASDAVLLSQYKAKSKKANLSKDVMSDLKGKSGVFYVNIESILNGLHSKVNVQENDILPKAKETFKELEGYADNFNGKSVDGHGELRFKNEKENSLTSLLSFIETATKNLKRTTVSENMNDAQADTSLLPKPEKGK